MHSNIYDAVSSVYAILLSMGKYSILHNLHAILKFSQLMNALFCFHLDVYSIMYMLFLLLHIRDKVGR